MNIKLEPLSKEAFAPFGEVLEMDEAKAFEINDGNCMRYDNLSPIDFVRTGSASLSMFRSKPSQLPLRLTLFEKHPMCSQAFMPMEAKPFCVVVTSGSEQPDLGSIKAFITSPHQGVNIGKDVWHHPLVALDGESLFWVADWAGPEKNLDVYKLDQQELTICD